ncbi:hypothetical protein D9756_000374 [Leucocoprinus leucothites]|uniref:DH domain-containing protein n=1 Tax=Leucocoprinus leucothites TaxID=201217 RepID=A0A8H5LNH2_9AGAR|nr:hypothetical protein D9756_000374 [Leucoagaricus leucothites]
MLLELITQRQRKLTDTSALTSVINELVASERTYVKRLQMLKNDYADPLRSFARSKETAIIPAYEAKTLFGNIDNLLPINEAFLVDLEKMLALSGAKTVGDVALRHFKELRGFEQYKQYYVKREDAQLIFEREASKRSSRFAAYIDHIKYQATDPKNRVGLRELLMEPVQRIPRYTLLFRTMLKHMAPDDPQRAKIIEADEIASKIALAEADEQTKRAAVFYCLTATIDGFPPDLFSNSRKFIDCIDVEDILSEPSISSGASSASIAASLLHCTLFLFDDKIVIVKRPSGDKGGKVLTGLDELDKVTKAGGIPTGKKKSGMSCKGVLDVTDVVATDVGGADFHLYLESPPQDQTERWSGRPFRSFTVVHPPIPAGFDLPQTESDKQRFLGNLWHVQAMYRSRTGQSVVLSSDEHEVECRAGKTTMARTYFNVYQRTAFLQEQKKTKIIVHIDPLGSADPIPFGIGAPPFARIRVQPLAGGLCRYSVSSNDPDDEPEEDIVQTERVPNRVIQTIHQFGLFEFKTGKNSLPSTPTSRSRVARFGLDAISRNLFNGRPGSAMDFFAGSINGHRRAKSSTISRSSTYTTTNTTGDGSVAKFSSRSNSTAATTVFSMDEDASFFTSKSSKTGSKKLFNRARSPAASASESDRDISRPVSRAGSLTVPSQETGPEYSDYEDEDGTIQEKIKDIDSSDYNLAMQLELARQNSLHQHVKPGLSLDIPLGDTVYEEDPPTSLRPTPTEAGNHRPISPRPESLATPEQISRPLSRQSDRRPMGPRSVSPIPIPRSPESPSELPYLSDDPGSEHSPRASPEPTPSSSTSSLSVPSNPTPIPRSKRQQFTRHQPHQSNPEATPRASGSSSSSAAPTAIAFPTGVGGASLPSHGHVEPLSIKKKNSGRASTVSTSPLARRSLVRNSPLSRPGNSRVVSPKRVSPQFKKAKHVSRSSTSSINTETLDNITQLAVTTKEDIEASRRVVKKIKVEVEGHRLSSSRSSYHEDPYSRPSSPDKSQRIPQGTPSAPLTKEARARMEEMRALIGKRQTADYAPVAKVQRTSIFGEAAPRSLPAAGGSDEISRKLEGLISDVDKNLVQALSHQDALQNEIKTFTAQFREKAIELERTKLDLQNSKRQCGLVKSLLADATAEKEIMYEAFNEELDNMYNDASLPDDEAWKAMAKDLQTTKESRNNLSRENSQMKRQIAELESQQAEWATLLRANGLIS